MKSILFNVHRIKNLTTFTQSKLEEIEKNPQWDEWAKRDKMTHHYEKFQEHFVKIGNDINNRQNLFLRTLSDDIKSLPEKEQRELQIIPTDLNFDLEKRLRGDKDTVSSFAGSEFGATSNIEEVKKVNRVFAKHKKEPNPTHYANSGTEDPSLDAQFNGSIKELTEFTTGSGDGILSGIPAQNPLYLGMEHSSDILLAAQLLKIQEKKPELMKKANFIADQAPLTELPLPEPAIVNPLPGSLDIIHSSQVPSQNWNYYASDYYVLSISDLFDQLEDNYAIVPLRFFRSFTETLYAYPNNQENMNDVNNYGIRYFRLSHLFPFALVCSVVYPTFSVEALDLALSLKNSFPLFQYLPSELSGPLLKEFCELKNIVYINIIDINQLSPDYFDKIKDGTEVRACYDAIARAIAEPGFSFIFPHYNKVLIKAVRILLLQQWQKIEVDFQENH